MLLPLGAIFANALRVRNCDLDGGLLWFALLPALSSAVASAVGVGAALFTRRARLLGYGVFVASVIWALVRFMAAPPVNAFDPFGGYFPGTLYDEDIAVPAGALLGARLSLDRRRRRVVHRRAVSRRSDPLAPTARRALAAPERRRGPGAAGCHRRG